MATTCTAFRLYDLKPCRNNSTPGCQTCHSHRTFYDKDVWKSRFLNLENKKYLLQGIGYSTNTRMGRIQYVIENSLNTEKIVLTQEDVAAMTSIRSRLWRHPHNSLTDVMTVICGTGKVMPTWNLRLLQHTVYDYFKLHSNLRLIDIYPPMENYLGRLLANPATSPAAIMTIAASFYETLFYNREDYTNDIELINQWHEITVLQFLRFVREALQLKSMKSHILLSDTEILSYFTPIPKRTALMDTTKTLITSLLAEMRNIEKSRLKTHTRQFKEGIAAAVWHPKNVERWLDTGGWPLIAMISGDDGLN